MDALTAAIARLEASLAYLAKADTDREAAEADAQDARDELLLAIARRLAPTEAAVRWPNLRPQPPARD